MISSSVQCSLPLPVRLHFGMWWLLKVNRPEICCMCSTCTSACGKQSLTIAGWLKTCQLAAHWSPSHKKEQERRRVAYIIVWRLPVTTVKLPTSQIRLCTASPNFPLSHVLKKDHLNRAFNLLCMSHLHEPPAYYLILLNWKYVDYNILLGLLNSSCKWLLINCMQSNNEMITHEYTL